MPFAVLTEMRLGSSEVSSRYFFEEEGELFSIHKERGEGISDYSRTTEKHAFWSSATNDQK